MHTDKHHWRCHRPNRSPRLCAFPPSAGHAHRSLHATGRSPAFENTLKTPWENCRRGRCNRAAVSLAERPPCTQDAAVCCHCLFIFGVLCCVVLCRCCCCSIKACVSTYFWDFISGQLWTRWIYRDKKSNKAKVYLFIFISGINKADRSRDVPFSSLSLSLWTVYPITQSIDIWDDKYIFIIPDLTAFEGTTCVSASLSSNQGRRRRPEANCRRLRLCWWCVMSSPAMISKQSFVFPWVFVCQIEEASSKEKLIFRQAK